MLQEDLGEVRSLGHEVEVTNVRYLPATVDRFITYESLLMPGLQDYRFSSHSINVIVTSLGIISDDELIFDFENFVFFFLFAVLPAKLFSPEHNV